MGTVSFFSIIYFLLKNKHNVINKENDFKIEDFSRFADHNNF